MSVNNSGASSGGNQRKVLIIVSIVVIACLCLSVCSIGGGLFWINTSSKDTAVPSDNPANPSSQPEVDPAQQTWLVLFYMAADDPMLEEDIFYDFNEIERVGSSERVKMVAQIDRLEGVQGDKGSSARRFYITRDQDLNSIGSQMVEDLGEVDMDDSQTLTDFAVWAIQTYPADRYVLILSDHGMGWPGGWTDATPAEEPIQFINTAQMDQALQTIVEQTGIGQFELIGLDACLMSMLEIYNALAPYSHYALASEEVEPGIGWAYTAALNVLVENPQISGAELAKAFVDTYVDQDQRIVDKAARAAFIARYAYPPGTSAEELIDNFSAQITLTALDLSRLPQVNQALNALLVEAKNVDPKLVANVRSYARPFTSVYGENIPSPYIDLGNFAALLAEKSSTSGIEEAAFNLRTAIETATIAERHGPQRQGASGISIYFPTSELYWSDTLAGFSVYQQISSRFADNTLWDDFLAFHYAGVEFGQGKPSREQRLPAPGAAQVNIDPLVLSSDRISAGQELNLRTHISGEQIAYIYLMTLYKKDDNNYLVYNLDYIQGDVNQEVDGVYHPVWQREDGLIPINLTWTPLADGICDGSLCAFNLLEPESYGANKDDIIYSIIGKYISGGYGQSLDARMYFRNDTTNMRNITGYYGTLENGRSAVDVYPQSGDEWLNLETWIVKDAQGNYNMAYHEGWKLSFGQKTFYFGQTYPDPGNYLVAIMVEDMDGQRFYQFAPFSIVP